jgi:CcmD family protein
MLALIRVVVMVLFAAVLPPEGGSRVAFAQPSSQPEQQDEFVPIDQLPPQDQLPAAPLLIAAYAFVMLALFGYVVSVARRLTTVQREIERLEADVKKNGRT